MKEIIRTKNGDISVLITILISSILLIFLTTLSQKVASEARIARENLMSQQAIQAAKTGLDAWEYQFSKENIDPSSNLYKDWPNINTPSSEKKDDWIILDKVDGVEIRYKVEFRSNPNTIIGYGKAIRGNIEVERSFEKVFRVTPPSN